MSSHQLCFDFAAIADAADEDDSHMEYWIRLRKANREFWKAGMVCSLPVMADIQDIGRRYSQMLPGVIEVIRGDMADIRIYAAPEWGYRLIDYPLHLKLAINVPLIDLGNPFQRDHDHLVCIIKKGLLLTGDSALGAEIRAREIAYRKENEN